MIAGIIALVIVVLILLYLFLIMPNVAGTADMEALQEGNRTVGLVTGVVLTILGASMIILNYFVV